MSEDTGEASEILFKLNKRRKIHRRRNAEAENEDDGALVAKGLEDASLLSDDEEQAEDRPMLVKRPNTKKRGINFTSAGRSTAHSTSEMSVVPYAERQHSDDIAQSDRFIKPSTGIRVVEDKHLTAYVDSKLAEMRSSTFQSESQTDQAQPVSHDDTPSERPDSNMDLAPTVQRAEGTKEGPRKGYPYGSRPRPKRARRQPPSRDEKSIARESMVDQMLAESQVPIYDRPAPTTSTADASAFDADETAAEAFKAEFLAGLEQRNRRRPPAPAAGTKGAKTSTGPKLGGSRSQREKMKALEEAKNAAGTK